MRSSDNSHLDKPLHDPFLYMISLDGYYEIRILNTYAMKLNIS